MSHRVLCVCGCGLSSTIRHHCVTRQELRRHVKRLGRSERALVIDPRNLVPIAFVCHMNHHSRQWMLSLTMLPDSVFEFAVEVLGVGPAYEYLRRHYGGQDARLEALLIPSEQESKGGS